MINFEKYPWQDVFKSELVKNAHFSEHYEFPLLKKSNEKLLNAIPFDKSLKSSNFNQWVHFYIHDYFFERIWNRPNNYLERLKKFQGVITPDFSLYRELPLAMQIWNTYRNRAIGYWLQNNGIKIIPNIRWSDERSYDFAFEGIQNGGSVAVSTNGTLRDKTDRKYFKDGLYKMAEVIQPETIINYSYTPDDIFGDLDKYGINVISIESYCKTVRKAAD